MHDCFKAVQAMYKDHEVTRFEEQGHCSFTFLITSPDVLHATDSGDECQDLESSGLGAKQPFLVQLRPPQHVLNHNIINAALVTYPQVAPSIRALDLVLPGQLCAYEMLRLRGKPYSRLQPDIAKFDHGTHKKLKRLVMSFADIIAQGLQAVSKTCIEARNARADSPMDNDSSMLSQCTGLVGSSIIDRLEKLAAQLPSPDLRQRAQGVLKALQCISEYPIVLCHGDLIPSNILVNQDTWEVTGLVDWAEAEHLPFGTCLYGLETLLGHMEPVSPTRSSPRFVYFDSAPKLRKVFWTHLLEVAPELQSRRRDVVVMRDLGVLLWYGIAWDNGAIDRVVNETDDAEVLACLRAFLSA